MKDKIEIIKERNKRFNEIMAGVELSEPEANYMIMIIKQRCRFLQQPQEATPSEVEEDVFYYVVEYNDDDGLDVLSITLDSYMKAYLFLIEEYNKKAHPESFIIKKYTNHITPSVKPSEWR